LRTGHLGMARRIDAHRVGCTLPRMSDFGEAALAPFKTRMA
jgi:hypothetical protein